MTWFGESRRGRIGTYFGNDPTLFAYWQLNGNALDNSGNGSYGTISGTVFGAGIIGEAAQYASGNYISLNGTATLPTTARTVMMWAKMPPNTATTGYPLLIGGSAGTNSSDFFRTGATSEVAGSAASLAMEIYGYPSTTSAAVIPWNQWCLLTFSWDGTTQRLFVNGKEATPYLQTDNRTPVGWTISSGRIGSNGVGGTTTMGTISGSLEETAIFSRTLSPNEIAGYYNWAISSKTLIRRMAYLVTAVVNYGASLLAQLTTQ